MLDLIYINSFAICVIILKFVTTKIFFLILQHYCDVGIVRISPPLFLRLGKEVNRLP